MKLTNFLLAVALVATLPLTAIAQSGPGLASKTFPLEHKTAERAASIIRPLLSADGTISIQPSSGTIVVTDRGDNLRAVSSALSAYDQPPRQFAVQIKLVAASRAQNPAAVAPDLRDIAAKLGGVLRFNSFEKIGELRVQAQEGAPVVGQSLSNDFSAEFRLGEFDPASQTLRIEEFELRRSGSGGSLTQVLKTTLNLRVGQTIIVGASRDPQSQRALMIVATATPSP